MGSTPIFCFLDLKREVIDRFLFFQAVEYVVESTGVLTTVDKYQPYLQAGAKKLL